MPTGRIKHVVIEKGFGFIEHSDDEPDLFFHKTQLSHELIFDDLLIERRVTFDLQKQADGRIRAVGIRPA